jgi:sulfur transfer complex TusBCD TusB component (DsrH family)
MIGLCTDSSAQVPPDLVTRYGVEVVPGTITIDHVEHLDGVNLDADAFYARFAGGQRMSFTSTAPSSGQFAAAYEDLIARGCTEVISLHSGAAMNAARLAAHATAVPVRVIDPGTAGFGLSCAAWAAGEAIARGAALDQVITVAERLPSTIDNLFIVGAGGVSTPRIALIAYRQGEPHLVEGFDSVFEAINGLASRVLGHGGRLRVAVGHSDAASAPVADAVGAAVGEPASVIDIVRYRIGPGGGGQAMPGTVSCYSFPAD